MTGAEELRQQMAEALPPELGPVGLRHRYNGELTGYGGVLLDALLPVVTAWAEREGRARAAEELRAAADEDAVSTGAGLCSPGVAPLMVVKAGELHARAAALADDGGRP